MQTVFRLSILSVLFLSVFFVNAQNITGTWAGEFNGEYLEINVQQLGNELCGFTYDYELDNKQGHCIANFRGRYDQEKEIWFLIGTDFIENSGSHVLMRIYLMKSPSGGNALLQGKVFIQSGLLSFFGIGGGDGLTVKKISSIPKIIKGNPEVCFPDAARKLPDKNILDKNKRRQPAPAAKKPPSIITKGPITQDQPLKDSTEKIREMSGLMSNRSRSQLERLMTTRKQNQQGRITIDVNKINLKLYDNGIVDNDTVSVFYNGRLLLSHQRLSEKAIELTLELDETATQHEITMFAENLGTIPPNTALVVVTAGNKRFELHSKASLEENAVLIFDYKPR